MKLMLAFALIDGSTRHSLRIQSVHTRTFAPRVQLVLYLAAYKPVGHAVPWFGVAIPREYFLTKQLNCLCKCSATLNFMARLISPVSHGAQYLTVLVSHGLSISASISPQYLTTLQYLTPVSHASSISTFLHNISTFFKFRSISKSQDLNLSGQDLTQNGDLRTRTRKAIPFFRQGGNQLGGHSLEQEFDF